MAQAQANMGLDGSTTWDGNSYQDNPTPTVTGHTRYFGDAAIQAHLQEDKTPVLGTLGTHSIASVTHRPIKSFEPKSVVVPRAAPKQGTELSHSLVVSAWEGVITSVEQKTFKADLVRTDEQLDDVVEIEIDFADVNEDDRQFISVDAMFYFSVARDTYVNRNVKVAESIVFRRLPHWQTFDIEAPNEFADTFFAGLSEQP